MTAPLSPADDFTPAGPAGRRAGLTARFLLAVGQEVGVDLLTPTVLARAVVHVLPVDAAGLSTLAGPLRIPLGASSELAAWAEELQASLGDGPCVEAAERNATVAHDLDGLVARWPLYTAELTARTPFRAVAAVALHVPGRPVFAALDLFTNDSQIRDRLDLGILDQHIAAPMAALLTTCLGQIPDADSLRDVPSWYQAAAGRRHNVWVAIGMVMANRQDPTRDALSRLRACARAENRSLDDLAADIVSRKVPLTELSD